MTAMNVALASLVGPEFLVSGPVQTAIVVGGGAALVSAVIGVFTVMRGQSFAGHALADVSSAGGAASLLLGIHPLLGFLIMAVLAAVGMEMIRIRRARERDLVTGVVLGAGLGLAALFLYFDVISHSTTGAAITVMFGSMFAIPAGIVAPALAVASASLMLVAALYRPLLLSSVDPELAALQGVRVRLVGLLHLLALALAVSLSAITVGAILSTALLVGPAAIALRVTRRPWQALLLSAVIGVLATWTGILLAWESYYWTPGRGWPVSFFVVTLIFALYVAAGWRSRNARRARDVATTSGVTRQGGA
ncbi:metal ABC transporter permease [Paraburkholderia sp. B3]|uniref:metal ABC transporter permease n=1 Tax=Paraburkholderia sp. B3 TaxID=3134791 RepID=UPI0039825D80